MQGWRTPLRLQGRGRSPGSLSAQLCPLQHACCAQRIQVTELPDSVGNTVDVPRGARMTLAIGALSNWQAGEQGSAAAAIVCATMAPYVTLSAAISTTAPTRCLFQR